MEDPVRSDWGSDAAGSFHALPILVQSSATTCFSTHFRTCSSLLPTAFTAARNFFYEHPSATI
jgi:hypothetical protein